MPIAINGSGTLTGVSVGGLPDGIVDTDMIAANAVTAPKRGPGAILQVQQTLKTDAFSTTSGSFVDVTGLSVNITPSSSSNKVLVQFTVAVGHNTSTQQAMQLVRQVSSSDTVINGCAYDSSTAMFYTDAADSYETWDRNQVLYTWLDSPSTTSQVNYRLRTKNGSSNTQYVIMFHNSSNNTGSSTITVMEVAA